MKRIQILLTKKQEELLNKNFRSASSGVRETLDKFQEHLYVEDHLKELHHLHQRLEKLLLKLEAKTDSMILEDYITYLHTYAQNRSFILPNRYEFFEQGGKKLLKKEQELYHSMRKDEAYRYTERKDAELRYGLDLSSYHHLLEEKTDHPYRLDLVVFSYDYRSVFLFLTDEITGEKKKLRTMKKFFIDTLRFIKPSKEIILSIQKGQGDYVELIDLKQKGETYE